MENTVKSNRHFYCSPRNSPSCCSAGLSMPIRTGMGSRGYTAEPIKADTIEMAMQDNIEGKIIN